MLRIAKILLIEQYCLKYKKHDFKSIKTIFKKMKTNKIYDIFI